MSNPPPRKINPRSGNFFEELAMRIKLFFLLLRDRRVNILVKSIPFLALIYIISPLDFIPLNPLDDTGIALLSVYLFIELCPDKVVEEHLNKMHRVISGEWRDPEKTDEPIDARFKEETVDLPPKQYQDIDPEKLPKQEKQGKGQPKGYG